jgi:hypothetical protein
MGSFAWFFMFFLIFIKTLPAISIAELKEILPIPRRRQNTMDNQEFWGYSLTNLTVKAVRKLKDEGSEPACFSPCLTMK